MLTLNTGNKQLLTPIIYHKPRYGIRLQKGKFIKRPYVIPLFTVVAYFKHCFIKRKVNFNYVSFNRLNLELFAFLF